MYAEDKEVIKNHIAGIVRRLMSGKQYDGSGKAVHSLMDISDWLDTVEAEPKPEPKPKKPKK